MIAQIFVPTAELVIPIRIATSEAEIAQTETQPVNVEAE